MKLEDTAESAQQWLTEELSKPQNPDAQKLIVELELTRLQGKPLNQMPSYRFKLFEAVQAERAAIYNALIVQSWEAVRQHYDQTSRFEIDIGKYLVEPVALDTMSELPDQRWTCQPSQRRGVIIAYDIAEEAKAKALEKEVNSRPFVEISISHLRKLAWDIPLYGGAPEPLFAGFIGYIESRLAEFRQLHGGALTPVLTFKKDDIIHHAGSDQLLAGYKVTIKSMLPQPEAPKKKGGLLSKLASL
jgi:hypothetical protein